MAQISSFQDELNEITSEIVEVLTTSETMHRFGLSRLPDGMDVAEIVNACKAILFPGYRCDQVLDQQDVQEHVHGLMIRLNTSLTRQITLALASQEVSDDKEQARILGQEKTLTFMQELPHIRRILSEDVEAALMGDPAAQSLDEIILCYPGIEAMTIYRLAHVLYGLQVPLIPRMLTEYAHMQTGIDIHPGAQIGRRFFIDHGTGVVIGETCHIGNDVKLYQGVTLGALSFPQNDRGELLRDRKRHPTIDDHVVIYANATILGGQTRIGHHAVVGSSVWLTRSVDPYTVVTLEKPSLRYKDILPDGQVPRGTEYQI